MVNVVATLKARLSSPVDIDLAEESRQVELLQAKTDTTEPALQRIFVHRGRLLTLMAVAYLLFFLDNCWSIANEFRTYDAIVRCPNLSEPDFLTKTFDRDATTTYYSGLWESCGNTEAQKQHRFLAKDVQAVGSWCLLSFGQTNGGSFVVLPFSNVAQSTVNNTTQFHEQHLDKVTADTAEEPAVMRHI